MVERLRGVGGCVWSNMLSIWVLVGQCRASGGWSGCGPKVWERIGHRVQGRPLVEERSPGLAVQRGRLLGDTADNG